MQFIGVPHGLVIYGAPNVTQVDIRPPEGLEWIFYYLMFAHTDNDNRASYFLVTDVNSTTTPWSVESSTLAANAKIWFPHYHSYGQVPPYFKLTHDFYVSAKVAALDGDAYIYVKGLYLERPENLELLLEELKAFAGKYHLPISSRE